MPETRDEVTAWVADEAAYWKQRARDAEAAVERVRALATTRLGDFRMIPATEVLAALDTLHSSKET